MSKRVLIIDDEPDLLKTLEVRLEKTGYQVFCGVNGKEALEMAGKIIPDLIILDVYLPYMNGDQVAKIMKKDKALKNIPVILISATIESLPERSSDSGAAAFFTKPFEPEDLISTVKNIIG